MENTAKQFIDLIHRISSYSSAGEHGVLPRAEFFALDTIYDNENITVLKLAAIMDKTPAATSKILRVMEDKNYIIRTNDKVDRRRVFVKLSKKGRNIINEARAKAEAHCRMLFDKLGEDDSVKLVNIMERIYDIQQNDFGKD